MLLKEPAPLLLKRVKWKLGVREHYPISFFLLHVFSFIAIAIELNIIKFKDENFFLLYIFPLLALSFFLCCGELSFHFSRAFLFDTFIVCALKVSVESLLVMK
jgi:hypothetical protein